MRCSIRTDRRSSIRRSKRLSRTVPTRFTGTRLSLSIRIPYRRYTRPTLPAGCTNLRAIRHAPTFPEPLMHGNGAVAGTKPVFGRRDPAGLLQPPERSGEHHVSRNQWSAHGLPADGRSQRSAESVQRTEQNRIGHRQKLRSVIPTHSTLTVPKRLPLPSANNPYLHGSLSRPKSFRSAEPEGVIIAP